MRGSSNSNARGNTTDRARRRRWLLSAWRADRKLGDEPACRCYRCGRLLAEHTVTVDRIVPGCRGGRYTRDNIRPACARCNSETGGAVRS